MRAEDVRPRLAALGLRPEDVEVLAEHFIDAEERGQTGHGFSRVEWLEQWDEVPVDARPERVVSEPGYERWDGHGGLGYLTLAAAVAAQIENPPEHARLVVCTRTFPTGALGWYVRKLADAGLVGVVTATSPARLASPAGGPPLAGTNPLAIAIPSTDGRHIVADVSMGAVTYGAVLAGEAKPEDLVPFGGTQAHKAFALAVGLQLLVDTLIVDDGYGAVLLVARPERDVVAAFRARAGSLRLPGDRR